MRIPTPATKLSAAAARLPVSQRQSCELRAGEQPLSILKCRLAPLASPLCALIASTCSHPSVQSLNCHAMSRLQQQQQRNSVWSTRSMTSSATALSSLPRLPPAASSHSQHSGSSSPWVSYSTLRAETLVYNSLAHRRSLQTTAALQHEVSGLPSTPRRPFLDRRRTSTDQPRILPVTSEQDDAGKEALDSDAGVRQSKPLPQEEKEMAVSAEADRQRETEAAEQSREETKQQEESSQPLDVLDSFTSSHPSSTRLARLHERRNGRHAAALSAFGQWEAQHKEQTALQLQALCSAFRSTRRSMLAAEQEEAQGSVDGFTQRLQQLSSASLQAVDARLHDLVFDLLDIGLLHAEGVQSLLSETVQRWNVWTVRNSKAVQELHWRMTAELWQQHEQQQQRRQAEQQPSV